MKILIILFFLVLINPLSASIYKVFSADSMKTKESSSYSFTKDEWLAKDKGMHLVGSFITTGVTTLSLKRLAGYSDTKSVNLGITFSLGLGLSKELYDGQQEKNRFSYKDLTADLIGSVLAYLVFR